MDLLLLFVLCNADYKLAFCEDRILDSDMKSTLHVATLVLIERVRHFDVHDICVSRRWRAV
jgi:hypothetical protein